MSEISKARERIMLNKRQQEAEMEERESLPSQRAPRKFTVSAFTHQFESKMTEMELPQPNYTRQNTSRSRFPETPSHGLTSNHFESLAKENTPLMLKTINIKISDISKMELPSSNRHL
jgi:hypothetical protein